MRPGRWRAGTGAPSAPIMIISSTDRRGLRLGLIGNGALAGALRTLLPRYAPEVEVVGALVLAAEPGPEPGWPRVHEAGALLALEPDLVIDAASHAAVAQHGPTLLRAGVPLVIASTGALADPGLEDILRQAAQAGRSRLYLSSGAGPGVEALAKLRLMGLSRVVYETRKPPAGWQGAVEGPLPGPGEAPRVVFEGSPREAARLFPRNANMIATAALIGAGFEATTARLVADPEAGGNLHHLTAEGDFGSWSLQIVGRTLPDNPRTSALTAASLLHAVMARDLISI